jgi:hypothetical protein
VTARFDVWPRVPLCVDALGPFIFAEHGGRRGPVVDGIADQPENGLRPTGADMQSRRAGRSDSFLRKCGALAGTFTVEPAAARPTSPRKINSISPCGIVNIGREAGSAGLAGVSVEVVRRRGLPFGGPLAPLEP